MFFFFSRYFPNQPIKSLFLTCPLTPEADRLPKGDIRYLLVDLIFDCNRIKKDFHYSPPRRGAGVG
jgi:hypothetical protein